MSITILEGPRKVGKSTYLRYNEFSIFKEKSAYLLLPSASSDPFVDVGENGYFYGKDVGVLQAIPFLQDGIYIDRLFFSTIVYGCIHRDLDYSQMVERYRKLLGKLNFPEFFTLLMLHTEESLEKSMALERASRFQGDQMFQDTKDSLRAESELFENLYDDFKDILWISKVKPFITTSFI